MLKIKSIVKAIDLRLSRLSVSLFCEKNYLITILFHIIYENRKETLSNLVLPNQDITVTDLGYLIEYFLDKNYSFVSFDQILNGLAPGGKYILLTFDDGYYNNSRTFNLLNEYKIPAVIFVSTNYIIESKCFYWDIVYRERIKRGHTFEKIMDEVRYLERYKHDKIENYIFKNFGKDSFKPVGNLDRPFTVSEVKKLANEKWITLGNHTENHAILTNYRIAEMYPQIINASNDIQKWTGKRPKIIAYPGGYYNDKVVNAVRECGLKLAVTTGVGINLLPIINQNEYLSLKRFVFWGNTNLKAQCKSFRLDYNIRIIEPLKNKLVNSIL